VGQARGKPSAEGSHPSASRPAASHPAARAHIDPAAPFRRGAMTKTGRPLRIYTLDGLPPEVVAVTFAKTSRVPDSFDAIARELTESDSSRFHEKWVIGYGHSSVAEHAVLSIAIENVSILGAKLVEENRLSSFTEKSTRYQVMDAANYYTRDALGALYSTYSALMPEATTFCDGKYGGEEWRKLGVSPEGKSCDTIRGLLPAAAKTNLGWTVNARSLRHALVKMASSPLDEMRELVEGLREIGRQRVPTLLKYVDASPYLTGWEERVGRQWPRPAAPVATDESDPMETLFVGAVEAPLSRRERRPGEAPPSQLAPGVESALDTASAPRLEAMRHRFGSSRALPTPLRSPATSAPTATSSATE